ncbi:Protein CBG25310 [Caenorhabditis briggsae]|uniref:Protein CBG25310 n=1 Tax=Caenorhabditis briggsae TaxID=6238 RepID=B6III0_CAEBR|nr:Protein CBG25310 [Caenorhabditis briggsae]CAR99710.1 Protein CBG25310 [Caenorhabditis briggsae]
MTMLIKWISVLFFFFLIPLQSTQKLTDSENKLRKETCGKGLKCMLFENSDRRRITDAPWNVAIEVMNEKESGLCTGTLISSRHVITARHCFALLKDDGYLQKFENWDFESPKFIVNSNFCI